MPQSTCLPDNQYSVALKAGQAIARPLVRQKECCAVWGSPLEVAGFSIPSEINFRGNRIYADEFIAATFERIFPHYDGLAVLKERQRKDEEEVAAGLRSARSLLMFHRDDLAGYTFTENPMSEYARDGSDW